MHKTYFMILIFFNDFPDESAYNFSFATNVKLISFQNKLKDISTYYIDFKSEYVKSNVRLRVFVDRTNMISNFSRVRYYIFSIATRASVYSMI